MLWRVVTDIAQNYVMNMEGGDLRDEEQKEAFKQVVTDARAGRQLLQGV